MAKKTYRVKKGDNYFKIAEKLWGNQLFAGQLIRANPGINKLFPGIVLKLPKVDINDPHPFFGQAAWERAGRTSGSSGRLPGQTPPQQAGIDSDRRREELLDAKLGADLPGYEYDAYPQRSGPGYEEDPAYGRRRARRAPGTRREDIPDWVYEDFSLEELGGFSHEEVWDEVNEFMRLAEELGLAPRQAEEPEGAGVMGAPDVDEGDGGVKVNQQPVKQGGDGEPLSPEVMKDWEKIEEVFGGDEEIPQVPPATPTATLTPWDRYYYTVKEGDTVSDIAEDFNLGLDAIQQLNPNLDVDNIVPGQRIVISTSEKAAATQQLPPVPTPTQWPAEPPSQLFVPQGMYLDEIQDKYLEQYGIRLPLQAILDANEDHWYFDENGQVIVLGDRNFTIQWEWDPPTGPRNWPDDVVTISVPEYGPNISDPNNLPPLITDTNPMTVGFGENTQEVIPRSSWGAAPFNLESEFEKRGLEDAFEIYNNLSKELTSIIVHHTDEFNLDTSNISLAGEDLDYSAVVKEIQRQHIADKGWADIAYHFLIAPDGTIYEGRDLRVRGTHTEEFNTGQVGIALIGNYDTDDPSPEQVQAPESLVASLSESYGIGCLGQHNHFNSTACPGDHLDKVVGNLREKHNMGSYQCYQQP